MFLSPPFVFCREELNIKVLHAFLELHEFTDLNLVQALRQFLWSFRLPGEAQKIDRMMEAFAQRYCRCNPGVFQSTGTRSKLTPDLNSTFIIRFRELVPALCRNLCFAEPAPLRSQIRATCCRSPSSCWTRVYTTPTWRTNRRFRGSPPWTEASTTEEICPRICSEWVTSAELQNPTQVRCLFYLTVSFYLRCTQHFIWWKEKKKRLLYFWIALKIIALELFKSFFFY